MGDFWGKGRTGLSLLPQTGREVEGNFPKISEPDAPREGYGMFHIVIIVQ